jgi:hypothetical protein
MKSEPPPMITTLLGIVGANRQRVIEGKMNLLIIDFHVSINPIFFMVSLL